jgi:hypothetical protein
MELIYFDIKGLAEVIRYILAIKDIKYKDVRYDFEIKCFNPSFLS